MDIALKKQQPLIMDNFKQTLKEMDKTSKPEHTNYVATTITDSCLLLFRLASPVSVPTLDYIKTNASYNFILSTNIAVYISKKERALKNDHEATTPPRTSAILSIIYCSSG